jgi:hypothetical protein
MSWLLQGSPDGRHWTLIDRQNDSATDFQFAVSIPMECRFIRMIQTQFDHLYRRLPNWDFDLGQRFDRPGVSDTKERDSLEFARAVAVGSRINGSSFSCQL